VTPDRVRLLTWNLFHGRFCPPRRLRLTRPGERLAQFTEVLRRLEWDVLLLQEAPPRWHDDLRRDLGASGARVLTDRNSFGWLRGAIAELAPDLIASNEGGSNQTLAGPGWAIEQTRVHTLAERPERRQMLWTRLRAPDGAELAVANLHASVRSVPGSGEQVVDAAARAVDWAGELPLVFGGDVNHSPAREPEVFEQLAGRFGLAPATPGDAIDHLLVRGLDVADAPRKLPDSAREIASDRGPPLQLSDHACVAAVASMK
jgi:endonuclease/exonuclease/phosphatase family metal-dependent hydrolase